MSPPRRTYVLTFDYARFRQWCFENGYNPKDPTIYYVKDFTSLTGLGWNDLEIIPVRGWEQRKDADQIALTISALRRANGTKKVTRKGKHRMENEGIFSWAFWKLTLERMIRAAAAVLVGVTTADGFDLISAGWKGILSATVTGMIVSMLLAIVGSKSGTDRSDPSFLK